MSKKQSNDIEKPPKKSRDKTSGFRLTPLAAVIAVVFIYFASQILALNIFAAAAAAFGNSVNEINRLLADSLVAKTLLLGLIALTTFGLIGALLRFTRTTWQQIGFGKPALRHVGYALIGYGWYFLLNIGVMFMVGLLLSNQIDLEQQQNLGFDRLATGASLWLIGFCLVILPALYEEALMRGVLYTGLRSKLTFAWTTVGVSVLFGAAHLEWLGDGPLNWAAAIDTFVLSIVLVYLREKSQSLWPAIILHALKNLVAFLIVFVFKIVGV